MLTNLEMVVLALNKCKTTADYTRVMTDVCIDADLDLTPYYREGSGAAYTRNLIRRTADYELLFMCWSPGQITLPHNHGEQDCWMTAVRGSVEETLCSAPDSQGRYKALETQMLHAGKESGYITDEKGWHVVRHVTGEPALTLHLYVQPIETCQILKDNKIMTKQVIYDHICEVAA